jgi:hypothetical protein
MNPNVKISWELDKAQVEDALRLYVGAPANSDVSFVIAQTGSQRDPIWCLKSAKISSTNAEVIG